MRTLVSPVHVNLNKKPKNARVIEGFPGFGLVATIATGFLIDHLKCEQIGKYHFEETPATIAIHGCKLVDPVGIFYCKEYNLVIIHSITSPKHIEWHATEMVEEICKQLNAKELITIEGVGSSEARSRAFFYSENPATKKKFSQMGIDCIGEGIIVGVTAGLLQKYPDNLTSIFTETQSQMPDSKAAAKIIEVLDKYLELDVDYKPLLKQAELFETKLKSMVAQAEHAQKEQEEKKMSYIS